MKRQGQSTKVEYEYNFNGKVMLFQRVNLPCTASRNYYMEQLSIGLVNERYAESRNDEWKYVEVATQEDI